MPPLNRNSITYRQQQPPKKSPIHQKRVILGVGIVGLVLIGLIIHALLSGDDNKAVANSNTKNVTASAEPAPKKVEDLTPLQPALDAIIKKYPSYDTSVAVVEINSGKMVQVGDSYPYLAASTTKVLTALLYFNNVEAGQTTLNEKIEGTPAQELLQKMINQSDNDAWAKLNADLTSSSLTAYAQKQGVTSYNPSNNTITSSDMAQLLAKLYKGSLINEEHTKLLYSWMQNTSEEDYIPPNIPKSDKLYHKAGYLADRMHDVAIIDNGKTPYILVIYSKTYKNTNYDFGQGEKMFAEITKQTLATFQ